MTKSTLVRQCYTLTKGMIRSINATARDKQISKSAALRYLVGVGLTVRAARKAGRG